MEEAMKIRLKPDYTGLGTPVIRYDLTVEADFTKEPSIGDIYPLTPRMIEAMKEQAKEYRAWDGKIYSTAFEVKSKVFLGFLPRVKMVDKYSAEFYIEATLIVLDFTKAFPPQESK